MPRIDHTCIPPPTPKTPKSTNAHHDPGLRMQPLAMIEFGIPVQKAAEITGMTISTIYRIRNKAVERGYDRDKSRQLFLRYVVDSKTKGGRPRKDRGFLKNSEDKEDGEAQMPQRPVNQGVQGIVPEGMNGAVSRIARDIEEEGARDIITMTPKISNAIFS